MVKRSRYAKVPPLPDGWVSETCPNPRDLPFTLLTDSELEFLDIITSRSHFSQEEFIDLLHDCFGDLLGRLSFDSLAGNLFVGECYADREYFTRSGESRGFIRVFRLGLVCAIPMPTDGSRFKYWFCYWRGKPYKLRSSNFSRPLPPHDVLSEWSFSALKKDIPEAAFTQASASLKKIRHWDDTADYTADECYRIRVAGKEEYLWVEIHTGAERYDEEYFIRRLLTAEKELKGRGRFVVIVPFLGDVSTGFRAIRKYNREAKENENKPTLELHLSDIIAFSQLSSYKQKLGFYKHLTRV